MGVKNANKLLADYLCADLKTGVYKVYLDLNILLFRGAVSSCISANNPERHIAYDAAMKTKQMLESLKSILKEFDIELGTVYGLCDGVKPPAKLQTQLSRPRQPWRVDLAMNFYTDYIQKQSIEIIKLAKGEAELEAIRKITGNTIIVSDDTDLFIGAYKFLQPGATPSVIIHNRRLPLFNTLRLPNVITKLPFQLILCLCQTDYTSMIITQTMANYLFKHHHDDTDYRDITRANILAALHKIYTTLELGRRCYSLPRSNNTIKEHNQQRDFDNYISSVIWYLQYLEHGCDFTLFYKGTGPTLCCSLAFRQFVTMAFIGYQCVCKGDSNNRRIICVINAYKQYLTSRNKPWYDDLNLILEEYCPDNFKIKWTLDGSCEYKRGAASGSLPVLFQNSPLINQIDKSNCVEFLNFVKLHDLPVPELDVQKLW